MISLGTQSKHRIEPLINQSACSIKERRKVIRSDCCRQNVGCTLFIEFFALSKQLRSNFPWKKNNRAVSMAICCSLSLFFTVGCDIFQRKHIYLVRDRWLFFLSSVFAIGGEKVRERERGKASVVYQHVIRLDHLGDVCSWERRGKLVRSHVYLSFHLFLHRSSIEHWVDSFRFYPYQLFDTAKRIRLSCCRKSLLSAW